LTDDDAPAGQRVIALTVDREGSVWAGTIADGLQRLSPRVLRYWNSEPALEQTGIASIVEDSGGKWWVGTTDKGIHHFENGRFSKLVDAAVSGNYPFIYSIASTSEGSIWAAGEGCLFRFRAGQPTRSIHGAPVKGEAIRALCGDGDTLWLGTYGGTLLKWNAEVLEIAAQPGTFAAGISSLACEAADTVWVGTGGGLFRWQRGKVQFWGTRDGLPTGNICSLHREPDGTLWIGTVGGGLVRMKDGHFVSISSREGLIDDVISQIIPDDADCLWLGCNRGIMRLERRELAALAEKRIPEVHPMVFGHNEGMRREQCSGGHSPTAIKTRDGRLLFPAARGIVEIDPRRVPHMAAVAPQASIESILVDNKPHAGDTPLTMQPGSHRLALGFTAPVISGGERVRFRHRLEGLDKEWIMAGTSRLAFYDGLSPGYYVFRVAASSGDGNWNEPPAALAFTVQPLFWQTLWFRVSGAMLLLAIGGTAAWLHTRRKHRIHIAELARERHHQEELAHFSRISTAGHLTAAIAHELNQPLGAILRNVEAAEIFLREPQPDLEELRAIIGDIRKDDQRAGAVIDRLRSMLKRHEMEAQPLAVDELISSVATIVRTDARARRVELEIAVQPDLPAVTGDRVHLQQVLLNLMINAMDAVCDRGNGARLVCLHAGAGSGNAVEVSVSDTGHGIPPEKLPGIFEPFFTTKSNGMGMGLAISRTIIEAHGGRIRAGNHKGGGAIFTFTIPAGPPELPA
jgi:signal transduction histidine kinase